MTAWGGRLSQRLTRLTLDTKGTVCHLCGQDGADTADHVVPRSKGGPDSLENLEPAHGSCNYARQDRTMAEWWASHPKATKAALAPSREW